ncbi:hypothetical protein RRG08_012951 [Elysia crispata]|uniref:Uncharacterized protein n=1 Tax=Elysia crispata TaxID=231223 RepID=A0AAE1A1S3_9GAST|nr:hypothetical protein RRG08_012951 [Elysia crispata]
MRQHCGLLMQAQAQPITEFTSSSSPDRIVILIEDSRTPRLLIFDQTNQAQDHTGLTGVVTLILTDLVLALSLRARRQTSSNMSLDLVRW